MTFLLTVASLILAVGGVVALSRGAFVAGLILLAAAAVAAPFGVHVFR